MEASAESPGSCGSEALWWMLDWVEVEEGREIGSIGGSDCLPSSECALLREGSSRMCWSLEEGRRWSMAMGEAR